MADSSVKSRKKNKRKLSGAWEKQNSEKKQSVNLSKEEAIELGVGEASTERENDPKLEEEGPWRNLQLILIVQNNEIELQKKVELVYNYVESTVEGGDGMDNDCQTVSLSRLIVFINDWIQSLLISREKKVKVHGIVETCLDFRCWRIFKFCLEVSLKLHIPLTFARNLLQTIGYIAKNMISSFNEASFSSKELCVTGESLEFYNVMIDCVAMLFSSQNGLSNENLDSWISTTMALLELVHKICSKNLDDSQIGAFSLKLLCLMLDPFARFLKIHPTRKNGFHDFVDKLLEPLLQLLGVSHIQIIQKSSSQWRDLLKPIEEVLSNALFHPGHLDGFLDLRSAERYAKLGDGGTKESILAPKSYHRHLFNKLEKIMAEKKVLVMSSVGKLCHLFVDQVGKQKGGSVLFGGSTATRKSGSSRHSKEDSSSHNSLDPSQSNSPLSEKSIGSSNLNAQTQKTVFDFFVQVLEPLLFEMKSYDEPNIRVGPLLSNANCILGSLNSILSSFVHAKVYVGAEDVSEGSCLNFLKKSYKILVSFASKILLLSSSDFDAEMQEMFLLSSKELFISIGYFLDIEYKVVANDLDNIWPMMLAYLAFGTSFADASDHFLVTSPILTLACQLVDLYTSIRQVHTSIFALCKAVRLVIQQNNDGEMNSSTFLSCATSFSNQASTKAVTILLCSQEIKCAIHQAVKSIPEGQVSEFLQKLTVDVIESLEWMKINYTVTDEEESGRFNVTNCSMDVNQKAEVLGRMLSEIYVLLLDSLIVTTGNCSQLGLSMKELINIVRPYISNLAGLQPDGIKEFLASTTGSSESTIVGDENKNCMTPHLWIFMFFFRLDMSLRSAFRQIISLVPPNMARKMSTAMGDVFATYTGWDWMEKTEWTDEVKFSWVDHSSHSLLDLIRCISDIYMKDNIRECSPLVYILLTQALQRLVDLNGQLKSLEYVLQYSGNLIQAKVLDDTNLAMDNKKIRKLRKHISILEQEAEGLTEFMLGFLFLVDDFQLHSGDDYCVVTSSQIHRESGWDLSVCSVNNYTLPTAVWWVLCQNVDIWCTYAASKKLKKFLTLLICTSIPCLSNGFVQVGKHKTDETGQLRKVTLHQVSAELLKDSTLYEHQFVRRNVASRLCKLLKISVLSFFRDLPIQDINFHSVLNWPEVLSSLELEFASVAEPISKSSAKLPEDVSLKCEAFPVVNKKSGHCKALLNLLFWMPKEYLSLKSLSLLATHILSLERCLIAGLLESHNNLILCDQYELLHLFLACRRTLKNIIMASSEKAEAGLSPLLLVVNEGSFFISWLSKSVYTVIQLIEFWSEDLEHKSKLTIASLMDHTSYILLTISKYLISCSAPLFTKTECHSTGKPNSGRIAEKEMKDSEAFRSLQAFAVSMKEQAECLLGSLKDALDNGKTEVQDSIVHVNKSSFIVSCFSGYLWGFACATDQMGQKSGESKARLVKKLASKLKFCAIDFLDFINTFTQVFFIEDGPKHRNYYDSQSLQELNCSKISLSSGKCSRQQPSDELNPESESVNSLSTLSDTNDELRTHVNESCQIENTNCPVVLSEVDLIELYYLNKNLLRGLLKGDLPEKAISLRHLLIASSAMLRLNWHVDSNPLWSKSISTFIAISQFLLSEFANSIEMPQSFSFIWLDGVLKFLEELGRHFPSANLELNEHVYLKLIMLHLRAIGKCISLHGKGAALGSHERELHAEMLHGDARCSEELLYHDQHCLEEFKLRLKMSFKVYLENSSELHLLSALRAIEKALVGKQEECKMFYEINTGSINGGNVSSTVAAAIDCLNIVVEYVTDRKCVSIVKGHIQSFIAALFNIILHLQDPSIFYRRVGSNKSDNDPDPGSVVHMCIEVLTRISGKHALLQTDSWHIGQSLHIPGALFQDFCQLKISEAPVSGVLLHSDDLNNHLVTNFRYHVVDRQFSVDLFAACCRLLCTVIKSHKSECERCIAVLEESVSVLLHCFEAVDADKMVRKGLFSWEAEDGVKCARSFRRIYEEIRQQKDIFAQHCFKFLSTFIWVYSGNGRLKSGFKRDIDEALRPGVYALIDACSANDLQYLHTAFGEGPCRNTLASLQHDYKLNFQYGGKV